VETFIQMSVLGLSNAAVYVLLGISVSLIFGVLGVLNFAQGDFMTLGAYVGYSAVTAIGLSIAASVVLIFPALIVVGVIFYFTVLRPMRNHQHEMVLVATFGTALLMQGLIGLAWGGDPLGIERITGAWRIDNVTIPHVALINIALAAIALFGLMITLNRTSLGRSVRATAQDRIGAQLAGVDTNRAELTAVVLSVALSGLAGLMILQRELLTPQVGFELVLKAFAVAIVAGLGRINGLLPAAIVIGLMESAVATYASESLATATVFLAVVLTLLIRPQGFGGSRVRV